MVIDFLKLIGSSVVIVALINMVMQNKSNQITHITNSRAIWRQDIKKFTKKINSSNGQELISVLDAIKVNLNGYGCHRKNEYPGNEKLDFFKDEHIWKGIDNLEVEYAKGKEKDKEFIEKEKSKLCQFLVLLLKFDWERSKDEIKKNMMAVCSVMFFCLFLLACCIQNIDYSKEIGLKQLQEGIQGFWILILPYFIMWVPYLLEKPQILKTAKWYKDAKQYPYVWMLGILGEILILYTLRDMHGIDIGIPMIFYYVSFILAMLYPISIRRMYMEYDNHIMEILQLDSLVIHPMKAEWNSIRVSSFFIKKGMNYRQNYKSNEFLNEDGFKAYINGIEKSRKVLRWCWCLDYFFRKKKEGLYSYISLHQNRCKCVVIYQQEGSEAEYSVGYQKKLWCGWINK